ncbi:ribbon-helix-helix domain-containing protein [Nisaea sediminum]|uniref:ribbon-helix-helix domain-containing protein n=1 Tax=Nisaea sediminum TaxID=2775867 RepID=UPI00186607A1|nr:ribbon-helix-helix domain-containing protein [Nisaea sediminum]
MSDGDPTRLRKRTVTVSGHQTSISLEEAFWEALKEIARRRELSINALVSEVDSTRSGNLSSALRVFVLTELQRGGPGSIPE